MFRFRSTLWHIFLSFLPVLFLVFLSASSCLEKELPASDPSIRGEIATITATSGDKEILGFIFVENPVKEGSAEDSTKSSIEGDTEGSIENAPAGAGAEHADTAEETPSDTGESIKENTSFDRAMVSVTRKTSLYRMQENKRVKASFNDLKPGRTVEIWFNGPVMESDPVQARAGTILII